MSVRIVGLGDLRRDLAKLGQPEANRRLRRGVAAGARTLRTPIRASAPRVTGNLARSVKASNLRGFPIAAKVGPRAPHAHLVIKGHRIVTHAGVDTGRRSTPNPFVDEAARPHIDDAVKAFTKEVLRGIA